MSTDLMSFPHLPVNRRSHETPADQRYRLITGAPCRITTGTIGAYLLVLLSPTPSSSSGTWYEEKKKRSRFHCGDSHSAQCQPGHIPEEQREGRKKRKKRIHMVLKVVVLNAQPGTDPFDELGPIFFVFFKMTGGERSPTLPYSR